MVAVWPADLPQSPLVGGFQETLPQLGIRTTMDLGPAKTRRRYTAGVTRWAIAFRFSETNRRSFLVFWKDTLEGGTQPFILPHPLTAEQLTCRIIGEPTFTPLSRGMFWNADMNIEILP